MVTVLCHYWNTYKFLEERKSITNRHFAFKFSVQQKSQADTGGSLAAQIDLITEQKKNTILDRERMRVQLDVLYMVKQSLEKKAKEEKEVEDRFPINDIMDLLSPST